MTRIGVLGLGRMGAPIAATLAAAGHEVVGFDPVRAVPEGAHAARSVQAVAAGAEVLVTVLPGIPEVESALADALPALRPGALWIDLSSNDPRVIGRLAERAAARGVDAVGAPMGGGPTAAQSAGLHFWVGGAEGAVERATPLLELLGEVELAGAGVGDGCTTKLLTNLLWFGQVVAVSEALLLGSALGLGPEQLRRSLGANAGGSVFISQYLDSLLDGDYLESFGIDRVVEELEALVGLAEDAAVPFELSALVARLHREALQRFGAIDGELLAARLLEERAGRRLRR